MTPRLSCIVPFCRRTARADRFPADTEIICGKHWRHVPRKLRRLHSAAKRKRSRGIIYARVADRLWSRCKRAAIEAAAGIA